MSKLVNNTIDSAIVTSKSKDYSEDLSIITAAFPSSFSQYVGGRRFKFVTNRQSEIKYSVDFKNKVIIAEMDFNSSMFIDETFEGFSFYTDTITAKSRCRDDDEFSLETGVAIARDKLLNKYYARKAKLVDKELNCCKEQVKNLSDLSTKMHSKSDLYASKVQSIQNI